MCKNAIFNSVTMSCKRKDLSLSQKLEIIQIISQKEELKH